MCRSGRGAKNRNGHSQFDKEHEHRGHLLETGRQLAACTTPAEWAAAASHSGSAAPSGSRHAGSPLSSFTTPLKNISRNSSQRKSQTRDRRGVREDRQEPRFAQQDVPLEGEKVLPDRAEREPRAPGKRQRRPLPAPEHRYRRRTGSPPSRLPCIAVSVGSSHSSVGTSQYAAPPSLPAHRLQVIPERAEFRATRAVPAPVSQRIQRR